MIKIRYTRPALIRKALVRLRKELGLKQAELAKQLGVSVQSVQRYEQTTPPESDIILRYIELGNGTLAPSTETLREYLLDDLQKILTVLQPHGDPTKAGKDMLQLIVPRRDAPILQKGLTLLRGPAEARNLLIEGLNAIAALYRVEQ